MKDVPRETCTMKNGQVCSDATVVLPKLVTEETCIEVPREICTTVRTNPRSVRKPVIKRWCPEEGAQITDEGNTIMLRVT